MWAHSEGHLQICGRGIGAAQQKGEGVGTKYNCTKRAEDQPATISDEPEEYKQPGQEYNSQPAEERTEGHWREEDQEPGGEGASGDGRLL